MLSEFNPIKRLSIVLFLISVVALGLPIAVDVAIKRNASMLIVVKNFILVSLVFYFSLGNI
jgi:hypothetical protein